MAQNIINQNLDQYGLQYGEGLNPYAPDVQIDNMPTNRGYTNFDGQEVGIINTDIGNQMADLSKGQMKALNNPINKFNIMDSNTNPQSRDYNTILNDVGFRAQDIKGKPPTKQNIIDYYNGTYKPQARLSNEEYLSRNNNLTANANNIGRDFTFDTTSPVPEDIDMQYTVGNEFNVAPQNRSMFERGKDLASSGIGKVGKVGMDAFNLIKNNNPIGLLTSGFGKLGDMFEYKGGDVTVDENGNIISAADLNKMNARGGYYTDAARNARNRTKSLAAFRAREATDSKRYKDLLLQEIKQTKAREAAAKAAVAAAAAKAQQTRDYGNYGESGGSYSGRGDAGATGANFSGHFATDSASYDLKNGGLATMFRQKR